MVKKNDLIKVEASAFLGSAACTARADEFAELGEYNLGVPKKLKVIYAEVVDGDLAGYFVCVTEASPHYVIDDVTY